MLVSYRPLARLACGSHLWPVCYSARGHQPTSKSSGAVRTDPRLGIGAAVAIAALTGVCSAHVVVLQRCVGAPEQLVAVEMFLQ